MYRFAIFQVSFFHGLLAIVRPVPHLLLNSIANQQLTEFISGA